MWYQCESGNSKQIEFVSKAIIFKSYVAYS